MWKIYLVSHEIHLQDDQTGLNQDVQMARWYLTWLFSIFDVLNLAVRA
jgi:hypothetical protein